MTFWRQQQFKALQLEWYKRLEESEFKDAEKIIGEELELKQAAAYLFKGEDEPTWKAREAYFHLMSQQIHEAEFRCEIDEIIMTWHVAGQRIKSICEELDRKGMHRCRHTVRFTIRKYEMRWGLREYTRKQLNQRGP